MNAVEIEQAISELALQSFDPVEFPFTFLAALGNKDTTLKRLRSGNNNTSDVAGSVLLRNSIHRAVCAAGAVGDTLKALSESAATIKAKFILATDGHTLEAEELVSGGNAGDTIACNYPDFPNHFRFLLPLAGISTIKEIKDNPIDLRATGRLNKLYVELLRENPAWATDERRSDMNHFMIAAVAKGIAGVRQMRLAGTKAATVETAGAAHRFGEVRQKGDEAVFIVASVSSESRDYSPVGYEALGTIVTKLAFSLYDAPLWNMALIASRLHLVWIATVCGKLETRYRYSNTLGWNTFPVPLLTEQNKADLTTCAENILLAREVHFPATIADLYHPEHMPENLRHAHERNDEVLERIYIGRRFKNDTERLEKLFELHTKMTTAEKAKPGAKVAKGIRKAP